VVEGLVEALADNPWVYLVVAASIGGSAVFPPLPSDSLLVTAMGLAAAGELTLVWVVVATLFGGLAGDLLAYAVGRILRRPARRSAEQGRGQAALHWLEQREHTWGPGLITVSRFVPGGTMAVGISAGVLTYPLREFIAFAALGAVLWTSYGAGIAYAGNALFPNTLWASLAIAVIVALGVGAVAHRVTTRGRNRGAS
jgi:membrane-associated protein